MEKNQIHHSQTKHIDVWFYFIKEILEEGDIFLQKIATIDNLAHMLTKIVYGIKFNHCVDLIHIERIWVSSSAFGYKILKRICVAFNLGKVEIVKLASLELINQILQENFEALIVEPYIVYLGDGWRIKSIVTMHVVGLKSFLGNIGYNWCSLHWFFFFLFSILKFQRKLSYKGENTTLKTKSTL